MCSQQCIRSHALLPNDLQRLVAMPCRTRYLNLYWVAVRKNERTKKARAQGGALLRFFRLLRSWWRPHGGLALARWSARASAARHRGYGAVSAFGRIVMMAVPRRDRSATSGSTPQRFGVPGQYDDNGVDVSIIRANLRITPTERARRGAGPAAEGRRPTWAHRPLSGRVGIAVLRPIRRTRRQRRRGRSPETRPSRPSSPGYAPIPACRRAVAEGAYLAPCIRD